MIKAVTGRAVHRWHQWWQHGWQHHTTDRAWLHRLITKWAKNLIWWKNKQLICFGSSSVFIFCLKFLKMKCNPTNKRTVALLEIGPKYFKITKRIWTAKKPSVNYSAQIRLMHQGLKTRGLVSMIIFSQWMEVYLEIFSCQKWGFFLISVVVICGTQSDYFTILNGLSRV